MIEVARSVEVSEPPAVLWARIGPFGAIGDWHPGIASAEMSSVDGRERRTLTLPNGAVIVEDRTDDGRTSFTYSYCIVESPLPVADYAARLWVEPLGPGSRLTWHGRFRPSGVDEPTATDLIAGIYEAGLRAIAESTRPVI
ncbi:MAG: SRPBCC family protein [Alphaproteobacteria bacterium]|nr:SRPBCC family protein [Alphaproteobacteria bacterium]